MTRTLLAALAIVATVPAYAQSPQACAPRAEILKHLAGKYREQPIAVGIADNGGAVLELLASENGVTWTLLLTLPNGRSCLVATGQDWQTVPVAVLADPA